MCDTLKLCDYAIFLTIFYVSRVTSLTYAKLGGGGTFFEVSIPILFDQFEFMFYAFTKTLKILNISEIICAC